MAISVVRLGSSRGKSEGVRIGTVRRPPRGVRKNEYASRNYYDIWLPDLAPSAKLVKSAQIAASDKSRWATFAKLYRQEMSAPAAARLISLLAALSHGADFSVGCYCEDEARCHRSILRAILAGHGARIAV